ncbi:alpha/beta hydrolase [Nonlabens xiamenensis]|uniref:alpha/beta hydrolase n=1 Tax=Nonlabens xiamenensis TaxID=2341043 RepID=UPI000F60CF4D|nr:alpha/beta hydrolase-fold protein [Nonlabens xiamenensis]
MKSLFLLASLFFCVALTSGQAMYRSFPSEILGSERNVKILKPRNYSKNVEKTYPLIIVLDGDYLFEPVAGMVDYLSYWDQMPEALVVGINQRESRWDETAIDFNKGLPTEQAGKFMGFLMEIKATMEEEFRTAPFTVIVGKDITANLASYYLMRKDVKIDAFIQIEPQYSELIQNNLVNKLGELDQHQFFYVATAKRDAIVKDMMDSQADSLFQTNNKVHVKHDALTDTNKYSVAGQAIPRGLDFIFKEYQLIDEDVLMKEDLAEEEKFKGKEKTKDMVSVIDRIQSKYDYIREVYGVEMKLRLVDLVTIADYVAAKEDWEQLIDIGDMAHKEYPDLLYGRYVEGLGYEGLGRNSRAVKAFNAAYALEPAVGITKDDVLDKVELLQEKD